TVIPQPDGGLGAEAIQLQLQRMLGSSSFKRSGRISRFLQFTVEQTLSGRADELKESIIAIEVYDRPTDFNPKIDPIVRNEARRLRARLTSYYGTEGRTDEIVIEIAIGSYAPAFRR